MKSKNPQTFGFFTAQLCSLDLFLLSANAGPMSSGYERYDHTLVECLPSPLGAASGQGETLAARRFELSEELIRINTHSWVP